MNIEMLFKFRCSTIVIISIPQVPFPNIRNQGGGGGGGGTLKKVYELVNLRATKFSILNTKSFFQCMGKIFCVVFNRFPLKFHTKYFTNTLKEPFLLWVVYLYVKIYELPDLRGRKCFERTQNLAITPFANVRTPNDVSSQGESVLNANVYLSWHNSLGKIYISPFPLAYWNGTDVTSQDITERFNAVQNKYQMTGKLSMISP